jgi:hypothetical membrane protein
LALTNAAKSGALIFVGAVQFGILLIVSEILYSADGINPSAAAPGYAYSVSANYVSDLGATCSAGTCYIPPSWWVFDMSIAFLGITILAGSYFLHREYRWSPATAMITLTGIGALGVGLFPETTGIWHGFFSLIVFLFAGLSAIVTYRFQSAPMSLFSIMLGALTLAALLLYIPGVYLGLGPGGMERMIVYPVLLWGIGFGAHLMAKEART